MDRAPCDPALTVWAEKIRVEQILVNLLRNAIDALEGRADPTISVRITATRDQVHYRVSDNGPGIPAQLADQLFTPFRTTKAQGLGLGLVISRDIAASLGGALNLVPPGPGDGGGAVFDLVLPRGRP
jgi:two-component system C4-dicarboxylate transport sensor histidine kinase DctB